MSTSNLPELWLPGRTLKVLLILASLTTLFFWLPVIRGAFDGSTYIWGLFGFSGNGLKGDYWFVLLGAIFGLTIQVLGWRGARMPVHFLLTGWFLFLAAGAIYLAVQFPQSFRFQGDTLGIDFSMAWFAPLLFGTAVIASIWWLWTDMRKKPENKILTWGRKNTIGVICLLALLPVQFLLLRSGTPHGISDQIGVILTILQWLLIGLAIRPIHLHSK